MSEVTHVNWLRGVTLSRVTIKEKKGNLHYCVVRELRNTELDGQCDACAKRHSNANIECSMTRHVKSYATEPVFYNFHTRKPVPGEWELVDVQTFNASLSREVWRLNAPVAATSTGAKLVGTNTG